MCLSLRELSFSKGDIILVFRKIDRNWLEGELKGTVGLLPSNYVEVLIAPPQPSHHSPLSVDPSLLPSSSLVSPLPCSSSTLPHVNTNIHSSKQTPSCIHNFHCTFTELTNSSFFTHRHTAYLWGCPTQSRSHPPCNTPHLHPQH